MPATVNGIAPPSIRSQSKTAAGTKPAVWFGPVLPQYGAVNATIKRLATIDPSFEAMVGQSPDLVIAQYEWHVGPHGVAGTRDQFENLGIRTYIAPSDCVGKDNSDGGDGMRTRPFTMEHRIQFLPPRA